MDIVEAFSEIKDFRRPQGRRYPLVPTLLIVVMSIACGYPAYREIERFANANYERLVEIFSLNQKKMPSHVTIRNLIQYTDFKCIYKAFRSWAEQYVSISAGDWLAVDGKAIASTVSDYDNSYQDFVSLVSVFSQREGQVAGFDKLSNKKSSEIPTFEEMVRILDLKHVVFTMDALHCQKKTLRTIVETDNDYLVKVKGNQPKLLESVRRKSETSAPTDVFETVEKNRGRLETREVAVFEPPSDIPKVWTEISRVIRVRRISESPKKCHTNVSYYISSITSNSAEFFAHGIRGHWHVENRLHYVKDVVMNEDDSGIRNVNAAANMSVFRNIVINIFRGNGFDSVKGASIFFAANILKLYNLFRT
jgi:predicted transposase YbfD/YdcC